MLPSDAICADVLVWKCGCAGFDCKDYKGDYLVLQPCQIHARESESHWRDMTGKSLEKNDVGLRLNFVNNVIRCISAAHRYWTIKQALEDR